MVNCLMETACNCLAKNSPQLHAKEKVKKSSKMNGVYLSVFSWTKEYPCFVTTRTRPKVNNALPPILKWKRGAMVNQHPTSTPWRMNDKWSGSSFLLGFSSLANHDGYLYPYVRPISYRISYQGETKYLTQLRFIHNCISTNVGRI
jgi:hypothetical protein